MKKLAILLFCLFLFACQSKHAVITSDGEPDISQVKGNDVEMNKAIETANKTLAQFEDALRSNDTSLTALAIKMRFDTPGGNGEHIWLTDISKKGDQFYGVIGNIPNSTTDVKLGDTVMIPTTKISDWMYIQNGKLKGGYTIRALRNQLSEDEKLEFDIQNGFTTE